MSTATTTAAPRPETFEQPWAVGDDVRITRVRAITTAPEGIALVVVRVDTNVDGLYGLGCATYTQRWHAVVSFVEEHLERLVVGRYPGDIEDLVRLARFSGYWREGPVTNNAISGLDTALWDIAGKRAGLPVHELLGGRVRAAADTYIHASGRSIDETLDEAAAFLDAGWRHVRLQVGQNAIGTYGSAPSALVPHVGAPYPLGWRHGEYHRNTVELFRTARERLGDEPELLHDVHSRLTPKQAVVLARALEPYRPFFLEDVVAPEDWDHLPEVREASPVPIAVGELTTSLQDAARLVTGRGVDLIRSHISAIGGLTAARKIATLAEFSGVRTAWHAPATPRRSRPPRTWRSTSPARPSGSRRATSTPTPCTRSSRDALDRARVAHTERGTRLRDRHRRARGCAVPRHPVRPRCVGRRCPRARRRADRAVVARRRRRVPVVRGSATGRRRTPVTGSAWRTCRRTRPAGCR
ncbi:enolase C-terminal domain-like protein [Curtobacterium flaccumfaciens]|nr:enolase C-terminal domain-like protein [Curtobacterium flaccumfaciens]